MNVTTQTREPQLPFRIPEYVQVVIIVMYSVITVIAIGGNGTVCYLVYAYKRMHTVPNYFIVNLACSDILMAVLCIPFTFVANLILNYWPFGETMCPIVLYLQVVAVFLSVYTLVAMSIDRYIVIVHPFKDRITVRQTVYVIIGIWVLSVSIPLPTLLKARILYFSNTSGQCLEIWENDTERYVYSLSLMILHYFGPVVVLLFSYTKITYNIWSKNIRGDDRSKRKLQLAAAKRRMIRMMITVVVFYSLCWLPLHTITIIGDNNPDIYNESYVPILWLCFHWLAMSNSCYNPLIYLWMSPKFRAGLRLAVRNCTQRKQARRTSDEEMYQKIQRLFPRLQLAAPSLNNEAPCSKNGWRERQAKAVAQPDYVIRIPANIHSDT